MRVVAQEDHVEVVEVRVLLGRVRRQQRANESRRVCFRPRGTHDLPEHDAIVAMR